VGGYNRCAGDSSIKIDEQRQPSTAQQLSTQDAADVAIALDRAYYISPGSFNNYYYI
jgi:hypothetical protein